MAFPSFSHRPRFSPLIVAVTFVLLLAACGGNSATNTPASSGASGGGANATTFSAAKGCKHVAFLSPDTTAGGRWEAYDHPLTEAAVKAALPGVTFDSVNAQNSNDTQLTQASSELTKGACMLIVVAVDSTSAAAIVQKAKASKVPVIAYDRLIQDNDLAFYATFDNVKVGQTQAQYIKDHHKNGDNVAMINGSQTDNNASLFAQGAHSVLDPLFASGELHKVYEQYTPNWVAATAQTEMAAALTSNNNNIQIAYVANDGMAEAVAAALKAQNLNGKVLVTGQDAELAAVRNILTGDQTMTVYKPIKKLADSVAKLVAALSNGSSTAELTPAQSKTTAGATIPSIFNDVVTVDKSNVATTVVADGYVTKEDLCKGLPAGTGGLC
ncbi:MAG: substrate-binding domain-containing protein [Chloroflexota bacterium]|nr:substrate-binding domain-containing protein [Chloroflexota bacterium]